jgi:hypothetical protein
MVASQAVEPSYGWPYDVVLAEFGQATAGPRRLAQGIVRRYAEFTDGRSEQVATQSAIDLGEIGRVSNALDAVASRLEGVSSKHWPALSRALFWADSFEVGGQSASLERGEQALASSDLLDILKRVRTSLGDSFPAEQEFHDLVEAVDGAILDNHVSRRHRLSHGLSIYAPPNGSTFNDGYRNARFARDSRWPALLGQLHSLQQQHKAPPRVLAMSYVSVGTDTPVRTSSMLDNTTLKVTVEGNNLLWVSALVGRHSPADKGHLIYTRGYLFDSRYLAEKLASTGSAAELLMPEFLGRTASMETEVAPMSYAIGNGEAAAFATLDFRAMQLGQGTTASIEAVYRSRTEGEHLAVIAFDLLTWKAVGVTLLVRQEDGRVVPRAVEPRPDDQLTLLYEFLPDGGELTIAQGEAMRWKQGLELIMDVVPNGTYRTWAIAENLSGETHSANASVEVVSPQWDVAAGFEGARRLSIRDLAGVWSNAAGQQVIGIGEALSADGNRARLLIDESVLAPEMRDYQFVAQLDTRLLPTLHVVAYDKSGSQMVGREVFMLLANPREPDRLWIKTMVGGGGAAVGEIVEVVRTTRLPQGPVARPDAYPEGARPDQALPQIVGSWRGQGSYAYIWAEFSPDGQYRQMETAFDNGMSTESWGTYALQGTYMRLIPAGGQSCGPYGCQPYYPPPVRPFPIRITGNVLETPTLRLTRQQ